MSVMFLRNGRFLPWIVLLVMVFDQKWLQGAAATAEEDSSAAEEDASAPAPAPEATCDFFKGNWVVDKDNLNYNSSSCPFIERTFDCRKHGRTDLDYLTYRWQPHDCNLIRFNGGDFLEKYRGKNIMFVGDSLSQNQWQSLTCMLYTSMPNLNYTSIKKDSLSTFTFTDYGVKVILDWNAYLVDVVNDEKYGRVLKLDSIEVSSKFWEGVDVLIFNSWNWWGRRGPSTPWDYIKDGNKIYHDMNTMEAFEKALNTWAKWVDDNVDPTRTKVFFQGVSPPQYKGEGWGEPNVTTCKGQTEPLLVSTYPGPLPEALEVQKKVLRTIKNTVTLLDITNLSLLRKDGHPSIYGFRGPTAMDCTHWCLAGVPDTWNIILYNFIKVNQMLQERPSDVNQLIPKLKPVVCTTY
ncbi:protein trichome birefringence-like 41 [Impatiens glandulifera]|uniref:protein trichome birefringence-like 41 n=1 Tax=Impatiens glandulifera TaxID=253017 RepID=UPI001FB13764|nr:protein trichome birefringence-like 41 [Impatiens glandulifera]